MSIRDIMEAAMRETRARWVVDTPYGPAIRLTAIPADGQVAEAQAHLDALIVSAQLRALREAGYGIGTIAHVEAYFGPDSGDLIPAALEDKP
jgi:hypothetical protein